MGTPCAAVDKKVEAPERPECARQADEGAIRKMQKEISKAEFRALLGSAVPLLDNYAIGFVLPDVRAEAVDASLGGSGTLVTVDDIDGILTARHVIEHVEKSKHVGLVLAGSGKQLHNVLLNMEHCRRVLFGPTGQPSDRPDLAFLGLPPDTVATVKAKKSFYNLSLRRERMLGAPAPLQDGIWVLSGFGGEWTGDGEAHQGFKKVKCFKGMHGAGKVATEYEEGGFDYLSYETLYNELYEGPDSYGGFSGGALWQLLLKPDGDELHIADRLLSGVPFLQSGKKSDANGQVTKEITCHGRRSVYRDLIDAVRASKT